MLIRSIFVFAAVCLVGAAAGTTALRTYLINGRTRSPLVQITTPRAGASCAARELRLTAVAGSPLRAEACENGRCGPADPNSFTYWDRTGKVGASDIRVGTGDPSAGPVQPVDGPDGKKWLCRNDDAAQQCVCIPWFQD